MAPNQSSHNTPRDFFLYLFSIGTLYFSAVTFITLLFQYINYFFPSPTAYYYDGTNPAMRFAISALIVAVPLYIFVTRWLNNDLDKNPAKQDFWVRRWLIYITLFATAVTMVVDLVVLLNYFLGGDFTIRFGLKVLSVLLVAAAVFGYYLFSLKRAPGTKSGARSAFMWVTIIAVTAAVIGAFFIVGSPATNRDREYDQTRISHLQAIQWEVLYYYQQKNALPASLESLKNNLQNYDLAVDPQTGANYQYKLIDQATLEFELCANFALPSNEQMSGPAKPAVYSGEISENWTHPAGEYCFSRTVDPDLYPQIKR